jgi:hypothetical protein
MRTNIDADLGAGTLEQITGAYRRMAADANYRPAAPSDGFGNITVDEAELDLVAEALRFADEWWRQEEDQNYWIGCPDWRDRPALIYAVSAANVICGGPFHHGYNNAAALLRLALEEIERR